MRDFIALFDSGIGGLSVLKSVQEEFKYENIVYLADTLNCPYGIKTKEEVKQITLNNINYLKSLGAKAIVIACNTATSTVIKEIEESDGFLIGVIEPTAAYAYDISETKNIALFATALTVNSKIYESYLKDAKVLSENCSDFVSLIENGQLDTKEMYDAIKNHLKMVDGVDTLILGCTHFPFIEEQIKKFTNIKNFVGSGAPTTIILKKYLDAKNKQSNYETRKVVFLTTGDLNNAKKQIKGFNFSFDEIKQVEI